MQLTSTFIINYLIVCCWLRGLSTLRLVKVEIPAYKFRGESALLECVYELNVGGIGQLVVGGSSSSSSRTRGRDNLGGGGQYYAARYRQPLEYISNHEESGDEDGGVVEEEFKYAKRKRKKYARYRKFDEDGDGDAEDEDEAEAEEGGEEDQEMEAGEAGEEFEENTHHRNDNNNHNGDFGGDVSHFPSSSSSFPSSSSMANGGGGGGGFPETLYSVKWYKDNEEFYRYVPKANPPQNSYKVEGIRVDHKHSDSTRVMLRQITIKSTGHYRCEISAEAPNFASIQGEGHMEVVYLPKDGPHIVGERRIYNPGDLLTLNCSSGKSHPASSLHWFINGVQVTDHSLIVRYPRLVHMYGLITTRTGLRLPLQTSFFHNSKAVVKCTSTISPGFWGSSSSSSSSSGSHINRGSSILIHGPSGRKESLAQATRHHSVIDSREDTFIVHSGSGSDRSSFALPCSLIFGLLLLFISWHRSV